VTGEDWIECVNCGLPLTQLVRPYLFCSDLCQKEAHTVRYARRVLRDGRIERPDVREAVQIQLAFVVSGGYPSRERELSKEQRHAVFQRDKSCCRLCGAQATQIDHIGPPIAGEINHPDSLRRSVTRATVRRRCLRFVPSLIRSGGERRKTCDCVIYSPSPLRISDDDKAWPTVWRQLAAQRKALVCAAASSD
jgi:hypothetical protein